MKETSYDTVQQAALDLVRETRDSLWYLLGEAQAAICLTNIYWNCDTIKVYTQHYVPQADNPYNEELTLITGRTFVSAIGYHRAYFYDNQEPIVQFENLNDDLLAISSIVQLVINMLQ